MCGSDPETPRALINLLFSLKKPQELKGQGNQEAMCPLGTVIAHLRVTQVRMEGTA